MSSATEHMKKRRESLGFSQDEVAEKLGVTKSYVSAVENGRRQMTLDQAVLLSDLLQLPLDSLLFASNRMPPDVEAVVRSDVAKVTAAIRTAVEQTPAAFNNEPTWLPERRKSKARAHGDVSAVISVTKTASAYRAHSYHTKVPPAAITPFIEAYTNVGDTIVDSFCGSGMTGVAARSVGRNSLLSDLSPAAVHIAKNYNTYCDPEALALAFRAVEAELAPTMSWLYKPAGQDGQVIEYTVWSDVFECPNCKDEITYWDQRSRPDSILCPTCARQFAKADLRWIREVPVETRVSADGRRHSSHSPTASELDLIDQLNQAPNPHWVPTLAFERDREMWRAAHGAMGIRTAADFYTRRNLYGLSAIRHSIASLPDQRIREAMMFAFTAAVNRGSRRYQWNEKRPTNVMTGTLYISSLRYEWNVWSLFKRKVADVRRYYEAFGDQHLRSEVYNRSATDLACLPDGVADLAFVDPPFGSNIYYADSSLLWDAWLGAETDQSKEIVVNQRRQTAIGGKDISDYGALLADSLRELHRVTKPGGRTVVAFSNSNDRVWEALQDAFSDSGFEVSTVHILDKGQPSIKGVKGHLGKEFVTRLDLAISLQKRRSTLVQARGSATADFINGSIRSTISTGESRQDYIYANVLKDALQSNLTLSGITMPNIDRIGQEQARIDQSKPCDAVADYISEPSDLPISTNSGTVEESTNSRFVEGGRGSAFYLAHSYHTKVPPESITPFIEHFTKPGDVILDPFCGSGMTGVAASLAGRKVILNDLSPAAVHIAWNHNNTCSPKALRKAFATLVEAVGEEINALYSTLDDHMEPATIRWTVWSTTHQCPSCATEFTLWDTIDQTEGRLGRSTTCPKCQHQADRKRFKTVSNEPAWVAFTRRDGSLGEKAASTMDKQAALAVSMPHDLWRPSQALDASREMYLRCALHLQGIRNVADLYTQRNLRALATIWREILRVDDHRVRSALAFAFTNTAWHGTKMRRYNARGGHRPMTGTLYVPQLSSEANVLQVMSNKISQLEKYFSAFSPQGQAEPFVLLGSATDLNNVGAETVDYVFTDPPFGSNIFYADCNLVWESWLGRVTDMTLEAVVNRSLAEAAGGKTLTDYGDLMSLSMKEIVRVLKPGGWATIVFHNTDKAVWEAIRDAALNAGLEFSEASSLGRKQQSHKGYKGRSGAEDVAHFDVIMNLRKPIATASPRIVSKRAVDLTKIVEAAKSIPEVAARGLQGVHAEVMRQLLSRGISDLPDFKDVRKIYEGRQSKPA